VFAIIGLTRGGSRTQFLSGLTALAVLVTLFPSGSQLWKRLHGGDTNQAFIAEDITGVSALTRESDGGHWRMSANGKGQSHLPFGGVHSKLGALPATLHPNPKSVAIIGLGSADTAWSAACRDVTENVTVFEICTSELTVLKQLDAAHDIPQLTEFLSDARVRMDGRDGRHVLMTETTTYDLIEADAIRPNGSYAGYLYSKEFFELCSRRLKPGGFMCSWGPTPRTHATFRHVFPHVIELDEGTILIGSNQPIDLDTEKWREQIRSSHTASYLGPSVVDVCLGSLNSIRRLPPPTEIESEWINTDLFPFEEFRQ
jgi:spermidine synthase